MGRKRKKPEEKASDERVVITVIKGSPEYKAWLAGVSEKTLVPVAAIFRDAVKEWAKQRGIPEGPKR